MLHTKSDLPHVLIHIHIILGRPRLTCAPVLAVDAQARAEAMRSRLQWAADRLGLGAAQAAARLDRLAFATLPVSGLSDVGANFLPYLLDHWRSPRKMLLAFTGSGSLHSCWVRFVVEV